MSRKTDPEDIALPPGYKIEVFAEGLNTPINVTFTDKWEMLVADAGVTGGNGKILKHTESGFKVIADGFHPPLTGITWHDGKIYAAHRGFVTVVQKDGSKKDILSGLPSFGDHHNNRVIFGSDGKMYFGQGTATNSGVVGADNRWVEQYPFFHDYPGAFISLSGKNFKTKNLLAAGGSEQAATGAFSPFGIPGYKNEIVKPAVKASGSILRANPDGTNLELIAWGLRNPFRLKFDLRNRLFCGNHGMDDRGSRPIANSPDEFQWIRPGVWYGWPDYTGGLPVTDPVFKPEKSPQPQFLLNRHPMQPPKPPAVFTPHSAMMGFDFNKDPGFGPVNEAFIAEFGSNAPRTTGGKQTPGVGHRVSRVNVDSGKVSVFAINKTGLSASETGGGGLERPIDVVFGSHSEMYIADFSTHRPKEGKGPFDPDTGVIWKVTKV